MVIMYSVCQVCYPAEVPKGNITPDDIWSPGIKAFIETTLSISQSRVPYTMEVIEHTGGVLFEDDNFLVESAKLDHRAESYGYRVVEKDLPGSLDLKRLADYGLKPGPLYGKLKRGKAWNSAMAAGFMPRMCS